MTRGVSGGVVTGVPWRPVASLTGSGLLLLAVAATWSTSVLARIALPVGLAALAAATAYLLDEAAAEAVAATPTSLRTRSLARLRLAAVVLVLGVLGIVAVAVRTESTARLGVMAQLAGCIAAAVAVSAALRLRVAEPGDVVGASVLAVVVTLAFVRPLDRWVDLFPTDAGARWPGSFVAWGLVTVAAIATVTRATRDPLG